MDRASLTGVERHFADDEVIVTKTDPQGRITYANRVFCRLADLPERDVIGKPHNVIRHPDMPKCVFRLLWDTIRSGREIFAYVLNRAVNGDHYWVFAHVTPTFAADGTISGYHSNRRTADPRIVGGVIVPLYRMLLDEERKHANSRDGMEAATALLGKVLREKGLDYDRFIFSL